LTTIAANQADLTSAGSTARGAAGVGGVGGPGLNRAIGTQLTPTGLVMVAALGAVIFGLFHYFFYVQNFQSWTKSEDWGHAYFIPLVSLYLIWVRRAELARIQPRAFWPGLIPLLLAVNCYALFQISSFNNHMLRGGAVILAIFGLVLLFGGPALMRVMFFPIAYLVFAVTLSEKIMRDITFRLQLFASEGAWILLNMIGVETDLKGNVLEVHHGSTVTPLNVAEACAGMRMVMGFIALGVAVALVATQTWWKRSVLVLLALPVALLMNVIRVATLGVLTLYDPNLAAGQSHMLVGTVLLVAAFFVYLGVVWALEKAVPEPRAAEPPAGWSWWRSEPIRWSALRAPLFLVPMVTLTASAIALPLAVNSLGIHLKKLPIHAPEGRVLTAIPTETENWIRVGKDVQESAEMVEELGTTNYLTRVYVEKNPAPGKRARGVYLHMTYYTGGIDTIPHVPERCMVGGGWTINGASQVVPLKLDRIDWRPDPAAQVRGGEGEPAGSSTIFTAPTPRGFSTTPDGRRVPWSDAPGLRVRLPRNMDDLGLRVTEFGEPKSGAKMFAGYFFIANGGITTSAEGVRLLAFDLRDDFAYYLKVQVSEEQAGSPEELADSASRLLSELLPEIMRCVPDWTEVQAGRYPADHPRKSSTPGAG
jgi:exosortase